MKPCNTSTKKICLVKDFDELHIGCMYLACPQHDDLRLSGPPPGQEASSGARTRNRRVPADLRADSLSTVPPTLSKLHNVSASSRVIRHAILTLALKLPRGEKYVCK
ncbi:hypothetical protein PoB_005521500 [Plakobranchus ocellatus]|uniref:Uncharacterized protein n=1 Tax=Plakobranchus ocellatus TaxID=259542 RepID=A0AAV4CBB6_9GAST|nr:hypothetical protein PoB_005521500 [Plakobranchus ocellatus]